MSKYIVAFFLGIVVLLSGFVFCQSQQIKTLEQRLRDTDTSICRLGAELQDLPPLAKAVARLEDGVLVLSERQPDSTVVTTTQYVPVEGSSQITFVQDPEVTAEIEALAAQIHALRENPGTNQQELEALQVTLDSLYRSLYITEVLVRNHGFCFVPALGVEYTVTPGSNGDSEVTGTLGARLYYYNRFGAGVETQVPIGDAFWPPAVLGVVDYRLPGLSNVAPKLGVGYDFDAERLCVAAGVNVFLK